MLLLTVTALTILGLAVVGAYMAGYARGLRTGTTIQNLLYKKAYEQVLKSSTDEQKRRLDDQVEAYERMCKAVRDTNDQAVATAAMQINQSRMQA